MSQAWKDGLPYELQTRIHEYAGNFSALRLVCHRWNQVATHQFLQATLQRMTERIEKNQELISQRLGGNAHPSNADTLIAVNAKLADLSSEMEKLKSKMEEQLEMSQSILANDALSADQQQKMLKLCDPHTEIMLLGGIKSKIVECEMDAGLTSAKRPNLQDERNPLLVRRPPPQGPFHPNPYHPYPNAPFHPNDPEPDHFVPPGFPVDPRSPFQPMPGVGGVPGRFPGQRPPPPGYNPDFDRDRDPFAPGGLPANPAFGPPGGGAFGNPHQHNQDPFGGGMGGGGAFF